MIGDSKRVVVRTGFPWWLRPFLFRDVIALTLGRRIWISERVEDVEPLLHHELVHVRQMGEIGLVRFLWVYLRDYLRNRRRGMSHHQAYLAIPFEVEALEAEAAYRAPSSSTAKTSVALGGMTPPAPRSP